ncbi:LysR family transcriptional regulator [Pseudomonas sp. ZM23]|uniref:LysR family transcriptional regulator n=1 Tax=Pseudomonas triclosanedens TaxID=2961893 RepID=A0ABY6ZSQ8_9PSED|nr:LysR family transcriptional regulator [Pseudomonas triclosanedens]MCP8467311.1 LysR family transcriptional regulator [Pseudomonas triclosanedens]MCP8472638.1 LysR family transcriptional regulator [Pseudomonas triclosanedens]MCP8478699.1 LysR family transcriptional regulator [Pseudomonas triclosanedens]WAI47873.1 LysR family transcriptional regulator [Pseudomonas triclosanedens]
MAPRITLRQLATFTAIAELGNVTQAATRIALSQSAASQALQELERALGTRLFDRSGKRLALNDNGRAFYPKASALLAQSAELESLFESSPVQLSLGASRSIGGYLLPQVMAGFLAELPESRLQLQVANSRDVIEALAEFRLDVAFIEAPILHPQIQLTPWTDDELLLVAAADHPLALAGQVTIEDLTAARWVLRESGSGTRVTFEQQVLPRLGSVDSPLEISNAEAIKHLVGRGAGITYLSQRVVQAELKRGELVRLDSPLGPLRRTFFLALHIDKYPTAGLRRFLDYAQSGVV